MTLDRSMAFSRRLRRLMTDNDVTEMEISLQTPIGQVDLECWLAGTVKPDNAYIAILADYFGCDEEWLATGQPASRGPGSLSGGDETSGEAGAANTSMRELAEWIAEQNDGIDYWEVVKAMLARDYPHFREWLKRRQQR